MDNEKMETLIIALLDCGSLDLQILDDCEFDMKDVIDEVKDMGYEKIDVNNLCYAMFSLGKREIQEWIENRVEELNEIEEWSEEEEAECEALTLLNVDEDIESFHNFIDTSIYVTKHGEIYEKYCKEAFDEFGNKTGFDISK